MKPLKDILHPERKIIINKFIFKTLRIALLWLIFVSIGYFIYVYNAHTPKTIRLKEEADKLTSDYFQLQQDIVDKEAVVVTLKHRNNNIYRAVYGLDTMHRLPTDIPLPPDYFSSLKKDRYKEMITKTWGRMDNLATNLVTSSIALDTVAFLAKEQSSRIRNIPAIWPIDRRFLRSAIGSFGPRIHPVTRQSSFHEGIDLPCNRGTKVYATADGRVKETKLGWNGGYGNMILIDHGYGYMTRYAHLYRIDVQAGQKVTQGEVIARSGNTGRSTGSHVHYEVLYRGKPVNPINYFRRDMSSQEFNNILKMVQETTYEGI